MTLDATHAPNIRHPQVMTRRNEAEDSWKDDLSKCKCYVLRYKKIPQTCHVEDRFTSAAELHTAKKIRWRIP